MMRDTKALGQEPESRKAFNADPAKQTLQSVDDRLCCSTPLAGRKFRAGITMQRQRHGRVEEITSM